MTVCWRDHRAAPHLDPETVLVCGNHRKRIHLGEPEEEYGG